MTDPESLLADISQILYTSLETQRHSFDIAREVVETCIPGDIVECGIAAGGNFATMIVGAMAAGGVDRAFWGFDSFRGIQLAGPRDTVQPGIGAVTHDVNVPESDLLVSSGVSSHSRDSVWDNLRRWGLYGQAVVNLVEGWAQETLPIRAGYIDRIAILRLDMDLYEPTKCAMEWLASKVVSGGYIIIDDWIMDAAFPDRIDGPRRAFCEYCKSVGWDWQAMRVPSYPGEDHQAYFVKP